MKLIDALKRPLVSLRVNVLLGVSCKRISSFFHYSCFVFAINVYWKEIVFVETKFLEIDENGRIKKNEKAVKKENNGWWFIKGGNENKNE